MRPELSVVVPLRDEELNVVPLHAELTGVLEALGTSYDPSCAVVTATSVSFNHCTATSFDAIITLDGTVTTDGDQRVSWNLPAGMTSTSTSGSFGLSATQTGDMTVTSTAITGTELTTMTVNAVVNGTTYHAGLDQSVALDVNLDPACSTHAVEGTLEAKRVWTARPSGISATEAPDAAAKVTWTGCGTATIQYSH